MHISDFEVEEEKVEEWKWREKNGTTYDHPIKITMIDKALTAFSIACVYRIGLDSSVYLSIFICIKLPSTRSSSLVRFLFVVIASAHSYTLTHIPFSLMDNPISYGLLSLSDSCSIFHYKIKSPDKMLY